MNTSLITDVFVGASHAEESSEPSNMMFSNSEMKLVEFLTTVIDRCAYSIYLPSILKLFTKGFY